MKLLQDSSGQGIRPVAGPLPTQVQTYTYMPRVGFKPRLTCSSALDALSNNHDKGTRDFKFSWQSVLRCDAVQLDREQPISKERNVFNIMEGERGSSTPSTEVNICFSNTDTYSHPKTETPNSYNTVVLKFLPRRRIKLVPPNPPNLTRRRWL